MTKIYVPEFMLRAILVDDERDAIESLNSLLMCYCENVEVVSTASSVLEGIKSVLQYKPDLVFLDIDLHNGTGFDILESIPDRKFQIIFVTAYNEHAIKAFRANAIDYLLKPVDIDELIKAVDRADEICTNIRISENKIDGLLSFIRPLHAKIAIKSNETIEFIDPAEIIKIEADGSYCTIFLIENKKIIVSKNMKEIFDILNKKIFFRTHHSQIINTQHVSKYCFKDGGHIEMIDGSIAMLSRRKKDEFLEMMNQ
ncbi:MAG: LytTR family DNA-binding domain-containing protein [Bacteroidota bacterium]